MARLGVSRASRRRPRESAAPARPPPLPRAPAPGAPGAPRAAPPPLSPASLSKKGARDSRRVFQRESANGGSFCDSVLEEFSPAACRCA